MLWQKKNKNKEDFSFDNDKNLNEMITNYLTDGLLVFNNKSKLVLFNPQAEKFFEIKKEKILGKSILELNRFLNFGSLVSLLGGGIKQVYEQEVKIRENFILKVTVFPIETKQEKLGSLVILHDISHIKLMDEMKSEFVTLAAHQLRTPTSAVKWSLNMLLQGDLGKLNEEQEEIIEQAYKTNNKVIRLVRDLLNISQIEQGKYLSKLTLSSIEEIIQSVVNSNEQEIEGKKIKIELREPETQLPKVMIDRQKMEIAIKNIFGNALRYTLPKGRISIFIEMGEKEIKVQIKDTGIGIPKDQQARVFSKFFRATNVMKMETEGTGIGLFISKNIIEAHGGRIWFESQENKGTTFFFILPVDGRKVNLKFIEKI